MKILSINSCGSLMFDKRQWIKDLCVKLNIDFLGIQESKLSRFNMSRLKSFWGNHNFDYATVLSWGFSGGIISLWDPKVFGKSNIWCDDNFLIVKGTWYRVNLVVYMVNVYALQSLPDKVNLWSKLSTFISSHPGDFIFMGDWNSVRTEDERCGSNFCSHDAHIFNDFIEQNNLFDIPLGGLQFTWRNKRGNKFSKIDRFFVTNNILNVFDDLKGLVLPRGYSDHSPLYLFQDKVDFGPTYFKIFDSWFDRKKFESTVHKAWEVISVNKELDIVAKFRLPKDSGNASDSEIDCRNSLAAEKGDLSKLVDLDTRQKANVKWDVEGDENTKFFHGSLKRKRCIQSIQGLLVDGVWIDNPNDIKACFFYHYKLKFGEHVSDFNFGEIRPTVCLDESDKLFLEANVEDAEIKNAVWCCGSSKAPGPDDISFRFIKHFWDLFKDDFYRDIRGFFTTGVMPKGANAAFFSLIPKVSN
ncbi:uncharacterized protein [Rutidosis leptorrhynchoides]|uniref:uncharacterized protein n=1 Tax=Rutidosis leptorrhynchoides TaxID=125765 RepID=UPI003A990509